MKWCLCMKGNLKSHHIENIRMFESTLMKNMGRPEAVLQSTEPVNDTDFKRMKQRWNQNYGGNKKVGQFEERATWILECSERNLCKKGNLKSHHI